MLLSLYIHPGSYSCWTVELLLTELNQPFERKVVNLHKGDQFKRDFLELSPRGLVPVLQSQENVVVGIEKIRDFLRTHPRFSNSAIFKGYDEQILKKLDSAPVGLITYGIAFHRQHTKILRYPYSREGFLDEALSYIMDRGDRLESAVLASNSEEITKELLSAAENHHQILSSYQKKQEYEAALKVLAALLQFFEKEFERTREGLWLGGVSLGVADIHLGLLLHRVWQLGMEKEMFEDGVRPHLALYYNRMKLRSSFQSVTDCDTEKEELVLKTDDDVFVDNARLGLGAVLLISGLYIGKKLLRK